MELYWKNNFWFQEKYWRTWGCHANVIRNADCYRNRISGKQEKEQNFVYEHKTKGYENINVIVVVVIAERKYH